MGMEDLGKSVPVSPEISGPKLQQRYPTHLCLVVLHHLIEHSIFAWQQNRVVHVGKCAVHGSSIM